MGRSVFWAHHASLSKVHVRTTVCLQKQRYVNISGGRFEEEEVRFSLIFTARRYASAVLAVVVCPSVRLSVCPSQAGIVSKRQHIESRKQRRTVAQGI